MIRVIRSTIIDAPTDRVWALLRDFNGHDRWHPAVAKSTIERNQPSDKVGCVRKFRLRDGAVLREQLLSLSDRDRSFRYFIVEAPVPLGDGVAVVHNSWGTFPNVPVVLRARLETCPTKPAESRSAI